MDERASVKSSAAGLACPNDLRYFLHPSAHLLGLVVGYKNTLCSFGLVPVVFEQSVEGLTQPQQQQLTMENDYKRNPRNDCE